jgi:acyl-CoA thioesterase-1
MHWLAVTLIAALLFAAPAPSWAGTEPSPICGAFEEYAISEEPLPQFAEAIAAGGTIDILTIGSATTVGAVTVSGQPTSASHGSAFPWQMARALHAALPKIEFRVTVQGGRGMTAEDMLPLLEAALKKQHYPLVLWQTGTVEAVRGLRPDGMLDVLHSGAERVREAGGDLVLIDPQFSRFLRANTNLDPYEDVMQQVATMPGVVLFHRFDLMRTWANDGRLDLERAPKAERERVLEELNACLGLVLARFVISGAEMEKK